MFSALIEKTTSAGAEVTSVPLSEAEGIFCYKGYFSIIWNRLFPSCSRDG